MELNRRYPVLPLRNIVIMPNALAVLIIERESSKASIQYAMDHNDKYIVLASQKNAQDEDPKVQDLHAMSTWGRIIQVTHLPEEKALKVLVTGLSRFQATHFEKEDIIYCTGETVHSPKPKNMEKIQALRSLIEQHVQSFIQFVHKMEKIPRDELKQLTQIISIQETERMIDVLASQLHMDINTKQKFLSTVSLLKRLSMVLIFLKQQIERFQMRARLEEHMIKAMAKDRKKYEDELKKNAFLAEFGEENQEIQSQEEQIKKLPLTQDEKEKLLKEYKKINNMSRMSQEYNLSKNRLDQILALPWHSAPSPKIDLERAKAALDENHFGMEQVKREILRYLNLLNKNHNNKNYDQASSKHTLCLVGPPGVGKTSIVKSIAAALERKYCKIALGGVSDANALRGFLATYVFSQPGAIMQAFLRNKVNNPVFLLDEIEKLGRGGSQGDPGAALLEILDPEQNSIFRDAYLDVPFDLSKTLFIATANSVEAIPEALKDRMHIITLSSYTPEEKMQILKNHLWPKIIQSTGHNEKDFVLEDIACKRLLEHSRYEAGVRTLERNARTIIADLALQKAMKLGKKSIRITPDIIDEILENPPPTESTLSAEDRVGVVTGLAWTWAGGSTITIEASWVLGKGTVQYTGNLRDVMKESAQAAYVLLQYFMQEYNLLWPENRNPHIHVQEGGIAKDGPSAGVTMFIAMFSMASGLPVRRDIAMTGEITTKGEILPVGGLKEKIIAAANLGITKVLVPERTRPSLTHISKNLPKDVEIIYIKTAKEALYHSFRDWDQWEKQHKQSAESRPSLLEKAEPQSADLDGEETDVGEE